MPSRLCTAGVINRSQKSIDGRLSIEDSLAAERAFFEEHPSYTNMAQRLGIPYLSKTLSVTLMRHVRGCIPTLRNDIAATIVMVREQLESFGGDQLGRVEQDKGSVCAQSPFLQPCTMPSALLSTAACTGGLLAFPHILLPTPGVVWLWLTLSLRSRHSLCSPRTPRFG